jgi:hypothetical protein
MPETIFTDTVGETTRKGSLPPLEADFDAEDGRSFDAIKVVDSYVPYADERAQEHDRLDTYLLIRNQVRRRELRTRQLRAMEALVSSAAGHLAIGTHAQAPQSTSIGLNSRSLSLPGLVRLYWLILVVLGFVWGVLTAAAFSPGPSLIDPASAIVGICLILGLCWTNVRLGGRAKRG